MANAQELERQLAAAREQLADERSRSQHDALGDFFVNGTAPPLNGYF